MILADSFYTLEQYIEDANRIQATLKIDAAHEIFKGHFPGQPVVPGVCMMQIVKELLAKHLNAEVRLANGHEIKFLSVIDPRINDIVHVEAQLLQQPAGNTSVTARFFYHDITFFKFKGVFKQPA